MSSLAEIEARGRQISPGGRRPVIRSLLADDCDLMFLLAERVLGLGPDPHAVTSMRRLPAPDPAPEPL